MCLKRERERERERLFKSEAKHAPKLKSSIALSANKMTRGTKNSLIYAAGLSSFKEDSSIGSAGCHIRGRNTGGGLGGLADEEDAGL